MLGFDVIIIGGGSAGCVLANRLSGESGRRILLLEAGRVYPPDGYPAVLADPERLGGDQFHDWGLKSRHSDPAYDIAARSGRVLGGSSAINAAVAKRARASDFARWRRHGVEGWGFPEVLQAYKALENTAAGEDKWHGRAGPLPIRQPALAEATLPLRAFAVASVCTGLDHVKDFNGSAQHGVGIDPFNVANGVRQNTGMVYLSQAVRARPNLTLLGRAQVDRVEFAGGKACGVRLVSGETIPAEEIVLCAGAYGSPAILMRSGIGPAAELAQHGIASVADLAVGKRLFDHPFYYNTYALRPDVGALRHPAHGVTVWTRSSMAGDEELDLQITASDSLDDESPTGRSLTLAAAVMTPDSVGCLRLQSRDPRAVPLIDYNLLATERDRRRMVEAVKLARHIARTRPLADLVHEEMVPGMTVMDDDDLEAAIAASLDTYHHGSATVPMGGDGDPGAVVDAEGRVRLVQGLHVVDASIFPEIPSTPTNLTTIMVAERIAARF